MSAKVDLSVDRSSTPSLPVLRDGQNSLVAPSHGQQSVTPRQKAAQWALETRNRINKGLEINEITVEDVTQLKKDLVSVFITTLQHNSRDSWVYLHEILGIVEPYKDYMEKFDLKTEMFHYLERLIHHAENNKEKLFDLQIGDSLHKIFPQEVDKIRKIGAFPARNYCSAPPVPAVKFSPSSPKMSMQSPRASFQLPDGTNPYNTHVSRRDDKYLFTKPLTLRDMSKSIADVAAEMAARESIWSQHYGTVTQALRTEIPESEDQVKQKEPVSKASTPRSSLTSLYGKKEKKTPRIQDEKVPLMTGREAVEYFAKLHHIGKIESIHLNIVPNRHYNPYDLISVHKNKVNPEHYVFSTFGVLHVYPDQPSESMSLADWQREAVLWTAITKIAFFKNFLVMKMFHKWRYNRNCLDFRRRHERLQDRLLQAVPAFGAALIQVSRLLKELVTVKFLPIEKDKLYQLSEFENEVNYKNMQAEKVIGKFFGYCKMVVDVTAEASFKKLHHCEEQVKKKTVFSKDSLHLQRIKHEQRQVNLIKARNETGRLGNFVKLADQLIVEHMYEICKTQVIEFVNEVLKNHSEKEGFFKVSLIFTKQDNLGLSPSKDKFIKALSGTLRGIPKVLCSNAIPIDGSLPDYHTEDTDVTKPETAETKTLERRKSTAATVLSNLRRNSQNHPVSEAAPSVAGETITGETIPEEEDTPITKTTQCGDDSALDLPQLLQTPLKSKEEDEMGIATPDLVLHDESTQLVIKGEGFMGQYSPLTKASLEEKLHQDKQYREALMYQEKLMLESLEEIDQYCQHHSWLTEIHHFCRKWTDKALKDLKGVPAFQIEQKLNDIRSWTEKVKVFERNFTTENGLFFVDCMAVHDFLIPKLNDIYSDMGMFVAEEATTLACNFCEEMRDIIESLKDKSDEIDAFATYAKNFNMYKKNSPTYQQRCEYIKMMFEVVRMSYRQLTPEEERDDSNVRARWDEFMLTMQEAAVFVNTKTPLMTHQLEDTHKKLDMEARELAKMATSEHFLDPEQNATKILIEMRRIRDKFYEVQKQLHQASKWREAIVGEPYDLTFLHELTVNIDVLQELWKYVEVSRHAIKDWKQMLFKKMNIKKALEKVIEWQAAAAQLRPYLDKKSSLPEGEKLLSHWFVSLNEFKKDLPVLHKLANDALKERHWKAIFVGMNETYDSDKQFTVSDLLTYDLEEHAQLIHSIYLGAIAEYDLELKINQISKFWEEREFKLAKHIPDSVLSTKEPELSSNWYTMQNDSLRYAQTPPSEAERARDLESIDLPKKPNSPRRRTKLEKYRQERAAAIAGVPKGMNVADDDYYKLIEVDELKYQLEDTRISIKGMLQSPYLGDMRQAVEYWNIALQQVEETTDLWFSCQKKWLYLLKVFEKPDLYKKFSGQSHRFDVIHKQFKDWMRVVANDSKILTVVHRKRGEKGYRLLQGENLRNLFLNLIQSMEAILKDLESLMGQSRMEFPRLYFISNEELVEVLGISRNPKALLDCAKKVFPGIQNLSYSLPSGIASMNTTLDFALNADKLEVTGMKGLLEEEVPFFIRVQAVQKATKWLKCLEDNMKNTMTVTLQGCVQARMEEGSRQPIHLLEELAKLDKPLTPREEAITTDIKQTFRHWLLRFPVQCVLVAEAILWARSVNKCFEKTDIEELKCLRSNTNSKLEQYIEVLRETYTMNDKLPEDMIKRLSVLLCNLIKQSLHQRDVMDKIIADGTDEESNFEWQVSLRYHMDIHTVLRAKTEAVDIDIHPPHHQVARKGSRIRKTIPKPRVESSIDDLPKLTRTKTTVSTDYHFSLCYLQQLGNQFHYDYEYQGPIQRIVLTPLTNRAFLSMTQALKYYHCATLIGPAGVGKSETIKELMKMFGRNLVTVNCNEDITLPLMIQYMMGMVQSGSGVLFDDTDRLTKGLMSVTAQHLDYIRTALKTLEVSSENQYKIRGQPRFDKMYSVKAGIGDKVIRRNSLTTLHPLPTTPMTKIERQNTVPHGFNEKGLVTYFEDDWVSEKDRRRRHSIEKEIEIKESDLYKNNRPPPLFYEHVKSRSKKSTVPDYSKLLQETSYEPRILGNVMFNGKLMQANAHFSCFMSVSTQNPDYRDIPDAYRNLMRPCALIVPDSHMITETMLCCHGFQGYKQMTNKLIFILKMLKSQLPRKSQYQFGLKDIRNLVKIATGKLRDEQFIQELREGELEESPSSSSDSSRDIDKSLEEHCLVYALKAVISPSLENEDDRAIFMNHLRDTFPMCASSRGTTEHIYNHELVKALKEQFKEDNLMVSKELIARMLQMNSAIEMRKGVILTGSSGSGKSTCWQTLSRAINRLNYILFAPDHSKDELATDRDLIFHQKKKLKIQEECESESKTDECENEKEETIDKVGEIDDEFLSAIAAPDVQKTKTTRRFKRMTNILGKVTDAIQDLQTPKMKEVAEHPKVDCVRLNPTAVSPQEFLGTFSNGLWQGGLLPKILEDSSFLSEAVKNYILGYKDRKNKGQELPSVLVRWIVLDGVMHPSWTESINTLFDEENKFSMANGGSIDLQDTTALIYETGSLQDASPATMSRCIIINFGSETVNWNSLFQSWSITAKTRWVLTSAAFKVWEDLGRDVFVPTLKFLKNECCTAFLTDVGHDAQSANEINTGIQEITTFLKILSVLLDKVFLRDDFEKKQKAAENEDDNRKTPSSLAPSRQATSRMTSSSQIEHLLPNYLDTLKGMFAFSYIWSFGGHIHERFKDKFSKFAHDAMYRASHPIRMPFPGTVFDYCIEESTGAFLRWGERQQDRAKILAGGYTITPDVEKYNYLIEMMLNAQHPVLLSGLPGVGKTTIIQNTVLSKVTSTNVLMSRRMTSSIFQNQIVSNILELKHKIANHLPTPGGSAGHRTKNSHLFYIDDLNTAPSNPERGYQPPLELLRQILTQRGCYDRQRKEFQDLEEAMFLASTTLPSVAGYGLGRSCDVMSSRLTRLFVNLTVFTPSPDTLLSMHGRGLQNWLEEFPTYSVEHHFEFARAMTLGLLELYNRVKEKLRPTPANPHYLFSLHDIARVVHGILLMSPRSRSRKMLRKKKDGDSRSSRVSRQTSYDSRSRTQSVTSQGYIADGGSSAPMMKVIGQLWCHECTRMFADRLISPDDCNWFSKTIEETALKFFCQPRDDPKSEMAAISEETHSQTGRGTPQTATSPPMSEPDTEEDMADLTAVDEVSPIRENDDQTTTSSDKLTTPLETPVPNVGPTPLPVGRTPRSPDTVDTRATGFDTEADTDLDTHRTGNAVDPTSESEFESEPSEDSDSSEDDSVTETETETLDTGRVQQTPTTDLSKQPTDSRASYLTASTRLTVTTFKDSSGTDNSGESEQMGVAKIKAIPSSDQTVPSGGPTAPKLNIGSQTTFKPQAKSSQGSLKFSKSVTFKAGLLADWEHEAYFGPLMSMEELKGSSNNLVDFIFSKYFMTTHTESLGMTIEKAYVEGTEENLAEALNTCLNVYNNGTYQKLDIVFFSEAIRHAARLSRVLAIQGGHAILLGMSYSTGRCTLARLAAYIAHCKLFEPKSQTDPSKNLLIVREHIKRACYHTGILGKPSVLLIHEELGTECLQDVVNVMADGTSPGLYSEGEIQQIVSHMMPGGVQTKRVDKIEQAFERFLKKVRHNLHVIVVLNSKGNSFSSNFNNLHSKIRDYPGLVKHACSIDLYRPWTFEAYVKIADVWLRDLKTKIPIPWHPTRMLDQISLSAHAMAYMHLSSKAVLERQFCHQKEPLRFYSPLTYMEFVHLFRVISAYIVKREIENIGKHEQALGKVNEAFGSINEYKREVSDLTPQYKAATDEIKDLVTKVEEQKEQYIASLDRCKDQEQKIEDLQGPLEQLRKEAQTDFDRVNPNYQAALTALNVINRNDLEEVKSFREPPELVKFVVKSLCLLFNVPQDWENAKLLLIRDNFMDEMMFFDKDHIPDDIFEELKTFVFNPLFDPELVQQVSLSAKNICIWVHAVYKYAHIHRNMQPRLRNLLEHEDKFTQAQAKLGQLRVEANRIKSALERVITTHKAAVKRAKTIERHMQAIERKIARAVNLMEHMSMQHYLWKSELRKARKNVLTSPGDALITAACVCYHGPLEDKWRAELLHDWQDRCKQGNFKMTKIIGEDVFPLSSNLEGLFDGHKEYDMASSMSRTVTESSVGSESTSDVPSLPQIKTYRYPPAIYDTSKYYKSELKKQESFEYDQTGVEYEDSDDEDEQSTLVNRNNFSLQEILSDFDELSNWRLANLPTDLHSIQNALFMRVSCHNRKHCWPLLIDPDNQAELWVKTIQNSKNVFSEKDVQQGTPDELDGIPLESIRSSSGQLPPSRGTNLTFSDVYTDDRTGSTNTLTDYTKRDTNSVKVHFTADSSTMGRHSRNTWNSEELRPVTSVTNSWENFSLHSEQNLDRPENNLWIIEADDPSLDSKIINAIVHGITILITHVERKPLDPVFRGLLLKHFFVDKEGNRIIKVGTYEFRYHPDFNLYLSTSVPLFLNGDGLHKIPIHRMCVINTASSDEAIMNHLLSETMKVEKKEFEGQKRSNENDIILHRQRLAKEHELIREKTLNLDGPLLEDQTMLNSLLACQEEIQKNKVILEETRYMGDHLEEKFAHYRMMIMHITVLYNMIKKMCVLHPYYYLPFSKFVEIFSGVMKSRDRGKGSMGAPQARAQELADATSTAIFKYVAMMMFAQHYQLLQLLVSMERLRMSGKASSKELSLFINNFDKQGVDETSLMDNKPAWIAGQIWIDCLVLEQLHHCYHGLRKSLIQNSTLWQEYFQHPISLMNPVPGLNMQELSVFQKCILWKICVPHRLSELANAMTLYEMGSVRCLPDNYNIREVYRYTDKTTPVVFVMPNSVHDKGAPASTKGYSYVSPTHEVKRLAKEVGMEGKVRVMNFGVPRQMCEVRHALEDCIQNGYWLLLQNYHLAEEPESEFYTLLKDIVYSKWLRLEKIRQRTEISDDGASLITFSKSGGEEIHINNTFRLWITTQADGGRLVPGVLVQYGIKVTCEKTGNFKSTIQKAYKNVGFLLQNWKMTSDNISSKPSTIMPLAMLHALLLQQSFYGRNAFVNDHNWGLNDLVMAVDVFKKIMSKYTDAEKITELVAKAYSDHCTDSTDSRVVHALVRILAEYAMGKEIPENRSDSITSLLKILLKEKPDNFSLRKAIDSMDDMTAKDYGLPESADRDVMSSQSRVLIKDMIQVIGAPELLLRVNTSICYREVSVDSILPVLISTLQKCPSLPETTKNQMYPIDVFTHFEVEGYKSLIQTIQSDLTLLQRRSKGEILTLPLYDDVIHSLNRDRVPGIWLTQTFPSSTSLTKWIKELPVKIQCMTSLVNDPSPVAYNLSMFLRPDRFIDAIKQTFARKHFVDINSVEFELQVMPTGIKPTVPPKEGVYIMGLQLHNALWDSTRAILMESNSENQQPQTMPYVWLKPVDISSPSKFTRKYKLFDCPVYCSEDPHNQGDQHLIVNLPLPTFDQPSIWYQQRVFLSSDLATFPK